MARNRQGLGRGIPSSIKKSVREACGFGCVVCGAVPYEYDHLSTEFHESQRHDPEDIVILCDSHHRMKTAKILSVSDIVNAKKSRSGVNSEFRFKLPITRSDFVTKWGSNILAARNNSIFVDGDNILGFINTENDLEPIVLSGEFRDRFGNVICQLTDNEIVASTTSIGDFTLVSNRFSYHLPGGQMGLEFMLSSSEMHITDVFHVKKDAYVRVIGEILQVGNLRSGVSFSRSHLLNNERAIEVGSTAEEFSFAGADIAKFPVSPMVELVAAGNGTGVCIAGLKPQKIIARWGKFPW